MASQFSVRKVAQVRLNETGWNLGECEQLWATKRHKKKLKNRIVAQLLNFLDPSCSGLSNWDRIRSDPVGWLHASCFYVFLHASCHFMCSFCFDILGKASGLLLLAATLVFAVADHQASRYLYLWTCGLNQSSEASGETLNLLNQGWRARLQFSTGSLKPGTHLMLYAFDRPTAIDINCSITFGSSIPWWPKPWSFTPSGQETRPVGYEVTWHVVTMQLIASPYQSAHSSPSKAWPLRASWPSVQPMGKRRWATPRRSQKLMKPKLLKCTPITPTRPRLGLDWFDGLWLFLKWSFWIMNHYLIKEQLICCCMLLQWRVDHKIAGCCSGWCHTVRTVTRRRKQRKRNVPTQFLEIPVTELSLPGTKGPLQHLGEKVLGNTSRNWQHRMQRMQLMQRMQWSRESRGQGSQVLAPSPSLTKVLWHKWIGLIEQPYAYDGNLTRRCFET